MLKIRFEVVDGCEWRRWTEQRLFKDIKDFEKYQANALNSFYEITALNIEKVED